MASQSPSMGRRKRPSREDWSRLRPAIELRYRTRQWTMQQICEYLQCLGYHTTTRMVKARLGQWKLPKYHRCGDLVKALRLLNRENLAYARLEPTFQIGERKVTLSEIIRFFKRKGIRDPIQWAHSPESPSENPHSSIVQLITPTASNSTQCSTPNKISIPLSWTLFTAEQRALDGMRDYCLRYLRLDRSTSCQEPSVHQFTVHGRFGDRMQNGIARLRRQEYPEAFQSFKCAFGLVHPLLSDCHPMAISQLLTVICEVAVSQTPSLLDALLRYTREMACVLELPSSLLALLSALHSAPNILGATITSLRVAHGTFQEKSSNDWRAYYVKERLCDSLYHGKSHVERSALRAQLLQEQEARYGLVARNVLWTLTNVADDQLHLGEFDACKAHYELALERADQLQGFGRAKIRFAAHEGLARVKLRMFDGSLANSAYDKQGDAKSQITEILEHLDAASMEASTWFDPTSRRLRRVHQEQARVVHLAAWIES